MPTLKQKMAFKEITENHSAIGPAMRKVGYTADTAVKPQNLTESKGWKELMNTYLPDKLLAKRHKELLDKRDQFVIKDAETGKVTDKVDMGPDTMAVTKGLDMAYKLKGSYAPEKSQALNLNIKGDIKEFAELEAIRLEFEDKLKAKYVES